MSEITHDLLLEAGKTSGTGGETGPADGGWYQALLEQRLREALEQVPNLDDELHCEAQFDLRVDGHAFHGRLIRRSGNERFDAAVLQAIADLALPPPPSGFALHQQLPFSTRARTR